MRVIAAIAVIYIHVSSPAVAVADEASLHWLSIATVQSLVFFAVPIFLMSSGYFLLKPKKESLIDFYSRRFSAVFIPAVVWITGYLFWPIVIFDQTVTFERSVEQLLWGAVSYHLYFLFAIVGIYIMTPFLRNMLKETVEPRMVFWVSVLWIAFWCADFAIARFLGVWARTAASTPFWFFGYFILGYAYSRYSDTNSLPMSKKHLMIICAIALLGNILSKIIEASSSTGELPLMYSNSYFSVFLALYAVVVFPLLLHSKILENLGKLRIIRALSSASLGVFLIHMMSLEVFYFFFGYTRPYTLITNIIDTTVLYSASVIVIMAIQQVPYLCVAVGGKNSVINIANMFAYQGSKAGS